MEEVLEQVIREATSPKFTAIAQAAKEANDVLESQAGLLRSPPHELRSVCLRALQLALESRQSKFISLAVSGFYKLLRDTEFHSRYEEDDETTWLPSQLLGAIQSLPQHTHDTQVELLKIVLNMSCVSGIVVSGQIVRQVVGVCGLAYSRGGQQLRTSAQSAASQAIARLVAQLKEESQEQEQLRSADGQKSSQDNQSEEDLEYIAPPYDEMVPVINLIADKLNDASKNQEDKKGSDVPALFLLECASTLLSNLAGPITTDTESSKAKGPVAGSTLLHSKSLRSRPSAPAYCSTLLVAALWQRLCPALVALLGSPVSQRLAKTSSRSDGQMGRGSGCLANPGPLFNNQQARGIYNVACWLVVLMGSVGEMRPVLESLLHRMLLYPPPQCRLDALKAVSELLGNPAKLVQLAGPILHIDPRNPHQNDLAMFRLVLDSLSECSNCGDGSIQYAVVDCVSQLLSSLEILAAGRFLSAEHVHHINTLYHTLQDGDYSGPLTYENKNKLPKYEAPDFMKTTAYSGTSDTPLEQTDELSQMDEDDSLRDEDEICSLNTSMETEDIEAVPEVEKPLKCKMKVLRDDEGDHSDASGDTEGPEEGYEHDQQVLDQLEACEEERCEQESMRLQRLNQQLQSTSNLAMVVDEEAERERQNAKHFSTTLCAVLPTFLQIRSTIEVDQAILEFSSKYCEGVFNVTSEKKAGSPIIVNADGIYLATYTALSLNLQMMRNGQYCNLTMPPPLTKESFVEVVHGSGVLVYLSAAWLGELYDQVVMDSFLQRAGYSTHSSHNCALINLLTDLDGLGSIEQGSQLLSDHRRLEKAAANITRSPEQLAGLKLCRRIVTCCWETVVGVLGSLLGGSGVNNGVMRMAPLRILLGGEAAKEESRKGRDLLAYCLNALQASARLANILGLQKRCGIVFSLLASACLPDDQEGVIVIANQNMRSPSLSKKSKKPLRLHTAHLLSVHVMMSAGLELGSHASDCWNHIFKCCVYLAELEHCFFSQSSGYQSFPRMAQQNVNTQQKQGEDLFNEELFSYAVAMSPVVANVSIEELIQESQAEDNANGFLSPPHTSKAICALTQQVDRLFDEAATQLNMTALVSFLTELCAASQQQLFSRMSNGTPKRPKLPWARKRMGSSSLQPSGGCSVDTLLLHRLAEVMLRVVRTGRPLLHIMRAWAVTGPHFMEAACHKDSAVSKKAVSDIHDIVNALLGYQNELPHFHFNEALFKPFENLLCLELCDDDVQDQIISSICEFVESCTPDIRSGWRPLFGALRSVRLPTLHPPPPMARNIPKTSSRDGVSHLHVVRDVFEAFLATDNVHVFSNAALDCILCLLKHIKGPDECESGAETVVGWEELVGGDLCLDALRYLHRCAAILASMHQMPACPVFHAAHRITLTVPLPVVDPHLPNIDENQLWSLIDEVAGTEVEKISYKALWPNGNLSTPLTSMDGGSGILQVWYLLLEGLAGATMSCPRRYQPHVLDTLFTLLRSLPDQPGPQFGMYCVNHLLLPLMQGWLRRSYMHESSQVWDFAASFKQYTGLTSDLVLDYLKNLARKGVLEDCGGGLLMLQQCLLVLVECITHHNESISRLGAACIRHLVTSCGATLPGPYWDVVVATLHRAANVALYPLYQLMTLFHPDSPNFYGDVGQVKVAARRDCTSKDSERLRQLSHQVFLLDSQRNSLSTSIDNPDAEDRSFIFLLYSKNAHIPSTPTINNGDEINGNEPMRVPFRTLVVGLLSHQILIQTLGNLLVQGSPHIIPSLANVLLQGLEFSKGESDNGRVPESEGKVPGFLPYMSTDQIHILLDALQLSYTSAVEFDRRPGLKFLIQKVAQAERAGNLYKQAGASWTLRMVTLFDLTLSQVKHGLGLEDVKKVLEKDMRNRKTVRDVVENDENTEMSNINKTEAMTEDNVNLIAKKIERPTELLPKDVSRYIELLRDSFTELCDVYLDLVIDRDGHYSAMDKISSEPIFFLTIQADEFPTDHRKSLEEWGKSLEESNKRFEKKIADSKEDGLQDHLSGTMTLGAGIAKPIQEPNQNKENNEDFSDEKESIEGNDCPVNKPEPASEKRPFSLADLVRQYSSDSEDSEFPDFAEGGDSGVCSLAGAEQSIYRVATEKDIKSMMSDYRRRKHQHSLPSTQHVEQRRTNPFLANKTPPATPIEPVPPEIEEQRSKSFLKDSEAHLRVWTEMVVTVFDLLSQLSDGELRPLLPLLFPTIRSLTAHAHDPHLRQVVAELLTRVATLYGFSPAE